MTITYENFKKIAKMKADRQAADELKRRRAKIRRRRERERRARLQKWGFTWTEWDSDRWCPKCKSSRFWLTWWRGKKRKVCQGCLKSYKREEIKKNENKEEKKIYMECE